MSVYLDHNATAKVRPEAIAAMTQVLENVGNPSSIHAAGRAARPAACTDEGLPPAARARATASAASGRTGAVAL